VKKAFNFILKKGKENILSISLNLIKILCHVVYLIKITRRLILKLEDNHSLFVNYFIDSLKCIKKC
jgi:hypothetical protein